MEIIIEILAELLFQIIGEVLLEMGVESISSTFRAKSRSRPVAAIIGIILLGCFTGWLVSVMFPTRILFSIGIPGISLIVSPLLAGFCMHVFGKWRRSKGHQTSRLATFLGGALFAFCASGIRLWMVGLD